MRAPSWGAVCLAALLSVLVALVAVDTTDRLVVRLPVIDSGELPQRPRTRADCEDGPRPCPWVSCKHHLFLEVGRRTGELRLNHGEGIEPSDIDPEESCALDVAERGEQSQAEVARLLGGVSIEWIRQCEVAGRAEMRVRGGPALRAVLALHVDEPRRSDGPSTLADVAEDGGMEPVLRDLEAEEEAAVEAWAEDAAMLVAAGIPWRAAWSIANAIESGTFGGEVAGGDQVDEEHGQLVEDLDDQEVTMQAERVRTNGVGKTRTTETAAVPTAGTMAPVDAATARSELRAWLLAELGNGPASASELAERAAGADLRRVRSALSALRERGEASCDAAGVRARWYLGATAPSSPAPGKTKKRARRGVVDRELAIALLGADTAKLELVDRLLTRLGGERGR